MTNKILSSVHDSKAQFYSAPMVNRNKGEAIRSFTEACNDETNYLGKNPEDFALVQVGEYNELTGVIKTIDRVTIITALETLK